MILGSRGHLGRELTHSLAKRGKMFVEVPSFRNMNHGELQAIFENFRGVIINASGVTFNSFVEGKSNYQIDNVDSIRKILSMTHDRDHFVIHLSTWLLSTQSESNPYVDSKLNSEQICLESKKNRVAVVRIPSIWSRFEVQPLSLLATIVNARNSNSVVPESLILNKNVGVNIICGDCFISSIIRVIDSESPSKTIQTINGVRLPILDFVSKIMSKDLMSSNYRCNLEHLQKIMSLHMNQATGLSTHLQ